MLTPERRHTIMNTLAWAYKQGGMHAVGLLLDYVKARREQIHAFRDNREWSATWDREVGLRQPASEIAGVRCGGTANHAPSNAANFWEVHRALYTPASALSIEAIRGEHGLHLTTLENDDPYGLHGFKSDEDNILNALARSIKRATDATRVVDLAISRMRAYEIYNTGVLDSEVEVRGPDLRVPDEARSILLTTLVDQNKAPDDFKKLASEIGPSFEFALKTLCELFHGVLQLISSGDLVPATVAYPTTVLIGVDGAWRCSLRFSSTAEYKVMPWLVGMFNPTLSVGELDLRVKRPQPVFYLGLWDNLQEIEEYIREVPEAVLQASTKD